MSTLRRRIERIENTPQAQSAARIARAKATGDLSEHSTDEETQIEADARVWLLAHQAEWRAFCDLLAGRIAEHAANSLREFWLNDLDTSTIKNVLAGVKNAKLKQTA